jgi:hypothetical protein
MINRSYYRTKCTYYNHLQLQPVNNAYMLNTTPPPHLPTSSLPHLLASLPPHLLTSSPPHLLAAILLYLFRVCALAAGEPKKSPVAEVVNKPQNHKVAPREITLNGKRQVRGKGRCKRGKSAGRAEVFVREKW